MLRIRLFLFDYFTYQPYKGALLLYLILFLVAPVTNLVWLVRNCEYINLSNSQNIDWNLEVGHSSSTTDPISWEDDFPQSSYPAYSDVRDTFTSVTTWYVLGVPMVDIYRIAFFKPIAYLGLTCDTGYQDTLTAKVNEVTKKTVKNIFWIFVLFCVILNIKAYHDFKNLRYFYDDSDPISSALEIKQRFEPLRLRNYLDQFTVAFFVGIIWRAYWIFVLWLDKFFVF